MEGKFANCESFADPSAPRKSGEGKEEKRGRVAAEVTDVASAFVGHLGEKERKEKKEKRKPKTRRVKSLRTLAVFFGQKKKGKKKEGTNGVRKSSPTFKVPTKKRGRGEKKERGRVRPACFFPITSLVRGFRRGEGERKRGGGGEKISLRPPAFPSCQKQKGEKKGGISLGSQAIFPLFSIGNRGGYGERKKGRVLHPLAARRSKEKKKRGKKKETKKRSSSDFLRWPGRRRKERGKKKIFAGFEAQEKRGGGGKGVLRYDDKPTNLTGRNGEGRKRG